MSHTITGSPPALPQLPPRVRCREISTDDTDGVVNLLTIGFHPARDRDFWVHALKCLSAHPTPPGLPQLGYLLESEGVPVGVILLIFSEVQFGGKARIQCNVSSWYVDPAFRVYGTMLISRALKFKHVTYFNVTAAPHTLTILEAQGYKRYCDGRVIAAPALSIWSRGARVEAITPETRPGEDLPAWEVEMLQTHAGYGCVSVTCRANGQRYPFIFALRRKLGVVPFAFLIYCRDVAEFVQFAGPLGRFLARRGVPLVILDADGPTPGLVGKYLNRNPKYFRGPDRPRLGNMAYSERAMFGV